MSVDWPPLPHPQGTGCGSGQGDWRLLRAQAGLLLPRTLHPRERGNQISPPWSSTKLFKDPLPCPQDTGHSLSSPSGTSDILKSNPHPYHTNQPF